MVEGSPLKNPDTPASLAAERIAANEAAHTATGEERARLQRQAEELGLMQREVESVSH
ncbi:MAG: hypothetical protein KGI73_02960 [Patescibacteria group bacterium]|nr:hypothetical protein [Patescibacteria group bacterium]